MIEDARGDLLKVEAEALVNTVNCVGVAGRGIALQFRKAFPENFRAYKSACDRKEVQPGRLMVFETGKPEGPRFIINFPTKRHWKGNSRIEDVEAGLEALRLEVLRRGIRSIAVPPLGCGLGGLDWDEVRPRIEALLGDLPDVSVLLFGPEGAPPADQMARTPGQVRMTAGRAALVELMRRYLRPAMDPVVSLLEIHKLMYFLQEAGEPLKLDFQKGPYGPYATNLRHVLNQIEGHFIRGYGDAGDQPDKPIELVAEAIILAEQSLRVHHATRERFERVTQSIGGFETPYGLELLATVHWVVTREGAHSLEDVEERTYAWNSRKRMFPRLHLAAAWGALRERGWCSEPTRFQEGTPGASPS